jgi:hypothetical protein
MESPSEIGGYFGLDLPDHGDTYPAATKFQSARARFVRFWRARTSPRVFVPVYICDSVIRAVLDAGRRWSHWLDDSLYQRFTESSRE